MFFKVFPLTFDNNFKVKFINGFYINIFSSSGESVVEPRFGVKSIKPLWVFQNNFTLIFTLKLKKKLLSSGVKTHRYSAGPVQV